MKEEIKEIFKEYKNPHIKKEIVNKKGKILAFLLFIFYLWQYFFLPESLTNFFLKTLKVPIYGFFFLLDIITLLLTLLIFKNDLIRQFKTFSHNIKEYFKYIIYTLVIFSIINLFVTIICNLIVGEIPTNQEALESYNIFYLIFSSLIYAPYVEELIFRGSLRKFISNDKLFIIISGVIFGLIHVIGSSDIIQYIYILEYGLGGAYLAFLYTRYNNIYLNITTHFILNLMGVINIIFGLII